MANVLVRLSLQNCIRSAPTVGFETNSGILASSMLSARIERYASLADGGMKVCSVYDGVSYFLMNLRADFAHAGEKTHCTSPAQYDRASFISASVNRDALGAGVLYEVVAYAHRWRSIFERLSLMLALVEYIVWHAVEEEEVQLQRSE